MVVNMWIEKNISELMTLLSPLKEGAFICYTHGRNIFIRAANHAAGQMFGTKPEQLKTLEQLTGSKTDADTYARIRHAMEDFTPLEVDVLCYRQNKSTFFSRIKVQPICHDESGRNWLILYFQDDSQVTRLEHELAELKKLDPLTGVVNRTQFRELLEGEINKARRYQKFPALLIVEPNQFQQLSETLSFGVSDHVITQLAHLLKKILRKYDIIGRWSDTEFALLISEVSPAQAKILGEKICVRVENHSFPQVSFLSVSVGISVFTEKDTLDGWVRRTRQALIHAKESKPNISLF
jgi:diguanylate cyclase (GGDEF)-like protein